MINDEKEARGSKQGNNQLGRQEAQRLNLGNIETTAQRHTLTWMKLEKKNNEK